MTPVHHYINYIEFNVKNMEISKTFYRKAFDWSFTDYSPSYAAFKDASGSEAGGFFLSEDIKTGGPLVILYSENLQQTRQTIIDAGGIISKETFAFPGGQRFQFIDPNGYELAVWSKT